MRSPIVSIFFKIVFLCFILNRILFLIESVKRMQIERDEDINLHVICEQTDRKKLGRHTKLCLDVDKRLAISPLIHAIKSTVDDTLYQELHFEMIMNSLIIVSSVLITGYFHGEYLKSSDMMNKKLPSYKKIKLN